LKKAEYSALQRFPSDISYTMAVFENFCKNVCACRNGNTKL